MHEKQVFISTLHCIFALGVLFQYTHAACAEDANGLKKFGPWCKYMCHCNDTTEQCDDVDGTCTSGCKNAWMGPGCQYRDIAFGEYSWQNDNLDGTTKTYSSLANDGIISTCSRTNAASNKPWWRLRLSRNESIMGLVLITETDKLSNFKLFKVTVEEVASQNAQTSNTSQLTCYTYPNINPPSKTIEVTCDQPLMNNQVRITLNGSSTQLVICDIRVYGGKNLAFGKPANQSSYSGSSSNAAMTVDGVIGTSTDKCSYTEPENQPWWSVDLNYIMNIQSVRISTSNDGWLSYFLLQGRKSSNDNWVTIHTDNSYYPTKNITILTHARYLKLVRSRSNVALAICEVEVFGECLAGRWGPGCDFPCGNCLGTCSSQTGHCPQGCQDGYKNTSTCQTACNDGKYGSNCLETCGYCRNTAACQKGNGSCSVGCAPGWQGDLCKQKCIPGSYGLKCKERCSDNCRGQRTCNQSDGKCDCKTGWSGATCKQACKNGTWGDNCSNECGHCLTGSCDRIAGICYGGCQPGYKNTSHCTDECDAGSYGQDCAYSCNERCLNSTNCRKGDGHCESCILGFTGDMCEQECSDGTYGISCLGKCGNCNGGIANCEKITGACVLGCAEGFVGYSCIKAHPESSSQHTAIIAGISAAVVVVVVIVVVNVIVIVLVLRRRRDNSSNTQGNENQLDILPSFNYTSGRLPNK